MRIHCNFTGGNIIVKNISKNVVDLECDLRDNYEDWFYWAFCVEGANGKTITFNLNKNCIGYFGPAKSYDLENFEWTNVETDNHSFTYTFKENEDKVYFSHSFLYHPKRFLEFSKSQNFEVKTLCESKKGRKVPYISVGSGEKTIFLTSRNHACESTGTYVLEGVLRKLSSLLPQEYKIICVPFVDYDGVVDGDQGKCRSPHDHNRDYTDSPIYPEVRAIENLIDSNFVVYGFDFHSPWHLYERNDTAFIVQKDVKKLEEYTCFGKMLEKNNRECSFRYHQKNDIAPNCEWNLGKAATIGKYFDKKESCRLAFTLETAYFGTKENVASVEKFLNLGEDFATTILEYIKTVDC